MVQHGHSGTGSLLAKTAVGKQEQQQYLQQSSTKTHTLRPLKKVGGHAESIMSMSIRDWLPIRKHSGLVGGSLGGLDSDNCCEKTTI